MSAEVVGLLPGLDQFSGDSLTASPCNELRDLVGQQTS